MSNTTARSIFAATIITLSTLAVLPAGGQTINETLKFIPSDGTAQDQFGYSIAIDNGVVAVGSFDDENNGIRSGSAYLIDAFTGMQLFKLLATDRAENDLFGWSIAINHGMVAVGARNNDINGSGSGSAYLFDGSTGTQLSRIYPIDGAEGDDFGISIAIDNGIVAIGAFHDDDNGQSSGSAYLFDAVSGVELHKLLPIDGSEGDIFGQTIAIDNGIVAIGSSHDDDNGSGSGSAYLFDVISGVQLLKLLPTDGSVNDRFGVSIDIKDGIVGVGAYFDDDNGENSGSAYLFNAITGEQHFKLLPIDGASGEWFGSSIAIGNGVVTVGARRGGGNASNSYTAYLFDASTGMQIGELLPSDGTANQDFGSALASDDGTVVVGSQLDDDNGEASGSAYIFDLPCLLNPADITDDGMLDFLDISAFLGAYSVQFPVADLNNDMYFDFLDISIFISGYAAGCP